MSQESRPEDRPSSSEKSDSLPATSERVVRAEDLFGRHREVWIDLDGVRYRLRITRRGKLILQK